MLQNIFHMKDSMKKLGGLEWIAFFLTVIGGINWALIGVFEVNLITFAMRGIGGELIRIVYILIGIAAIYIAWLGPRLMKR